MFLGYAAAVTGIFGMNLNDAHQESRVRSGLSNACKVTCSLRACNRNELTTQRQGVLYSVMLCCLRVTELVRRCRDQLGSGFCGGYSWRLLLLRQEGHMGFLSVHEP